MKFKFKLIRHRKSTTLPTLGTLFVYKDGVEIYSVETLELPWKNNERRISCIPWGNFPIRKRWSKKYGWHFHIIKVPDRSWILIHSGNFVRQILGCILPGLSHTDIDGDGVTDVTNSRKALNKLLELVDTKETFEIEII